MSEIGRNERAFYEILKRRGKVSNLSFEEFIETAKEVVATIPPTKITPVEELIDSIEAKILTRRKVWSDLSFFRQTWGGSN